MTYTLAGYNMFVKNIHQNFVTFLHHRYFNIIYLHFNRKTLPLVFSSCQLIYRRRIIGASFATNRKGERGRDNHLTLVQLQILTFSSSISGNNPDQRRGP